MTRVEEYEPESHQGPGGVGIWLWAFSKRGPDGYERSIPLPYDLWDDGWTPVTEERAERLQVRYRRQAAKLAREK